MDTCSLIDTCSHIDPCSGVEVACAHAVTWTHTWSEVDTSTSIDTCVHMDTCSHRGTCSCMDTWVCMDTWGCMDTNGLTYTGGYMETCSHILLCVISWHTEICHWFIPISNIPLKFLCLQYLNYVKTSDLVSKNRFIVQKKNDLKVRDFQNELWHLFRKFLSVLANRRHLITLLLAKKTKTNVCERKISSEICV